MAANIIDGRAVAAGIASLVAAETRRLHAEAGRAAARRQGANEGVVASDVIAALPAVRGGAAR